MSSNPEPDGLPLGWLGRALLTVWGLALLAGFVLAYRLEPDPRGFGTHQRLGLPPCTIRLMFGVPCPSCGMTTSFANVTKGRWHEAARANASAILLSIVCAVLIPWSWLSAFYGRLCWVKRPQILALSLLLIVCCASAVEWIVRLVLYSTPPV